MRGTAFTLLCAVALAQGDIIQLTRSGRACFCNPAEADNVCSQSGSNGFLIVHENCNQFYKCFNGKKHPYFCAPGTVYNPLAESCDWPSNVDCNGRPVVQVPIDESGGNGGDNGGETIPGTCNCDPSEAPTICAAENANGVFVAHENCNQFFVCVHGAPLTQNCPTGLLYEPHLARCDWPDKVDCGSRPVIKVEDSNNDNTVTETRPDTCNCDPSEAPSICAAEGSDGTLIAHENCNQFYKCDHGKPVTVTCPSGLVFDPYLKRCEWCEKVECGDKPTVEIEDCDDVNTGGVDGDNDGGSIGGDNGVGDNGAGDNGGVSNPGTCNCNPSEAPGICAADGSDGVLVAHENCNQFYKCFNGKPVTLNCPNNLLYDPKLEICDWPHNVVCGDRPIVEIDNGGGDNGGGDNGGGDNGGGDNGSGDNGGVSNPGTCNCNPSEAPGICAADGSDGVLVAHENCNQFYKCFNGKPVTLNCPNNLLYDPKLEICDWPHNVVCGDRPIVEIDNGGGDNGGGDNGGGDNGGGDNGSGDNGGVSNPGTCNCNPSEAPGICAADGSDGVLVAHENCNQFYKCFNGKPVTLNCPSNLLYDPKLEICDWPHNVVCGDRPIVEIDNGGGDNGGGDNGGGDNGGGDNGSGDNGGVSNPGTCNCNPSEAPGICAADGSDGVLVAHENCNQFYKCFNGKPVTLICPSNLLYDPKLEICDWPHNVVCGDRPIVEIDNGGGDNGGGDNGGGDNGGGDNGSGDNGGVSNPGTCNCNPSEAPGICAADGSDGVLVAHENCNQFYKCFNGKPVTLNCPNNLLYDPKLEICDWPHNVVCGDRPIVEIDNGGGDNGGGDNGGGDNGGGDNGSGDNGGVSNPGTCNCNPSEAPGICAADGSDGVLVAHENCNQFYKCSYGKPVTMNCPNNLLYDPKLEICDWPHNVVCGDRPIVEIEDGGSDNGSGGNNENNDNNKPGGTEVGDNGNQSGEPCEEENNGNSECNCNPSEAANICSAKDSEGVLVAHSNCNQFYKCSGGVPVALFCPPTLMYNPYTEQCDWPHKVECGNRPIVDVPEAPIDGGDSGGDDNGSGNNVGSCNCNPAEAPAICATGESEGVLIAHQKCNFFYKCSYGLPVAIRCYGSLLYNPYIEACDWPQNVECGDRVISETEEDTDDSGDSNIIEVNGHGDPSEAPAICAAADSNGVLVAHENCNKYYVCLGGTPIALQCPVNLLYNYNKEQCDWPRNVDCGNRIVPDDGSSGDGDCNCYARQAPEICAGAHSDGKMVAHEDCSKFFVCFNSIPIALQCPAGLFYDPHSEACNWAFKVDCEGRTRTALYSAANKHSQARRGIV